MKKSLYNISYILKISNKKIRSNILVIFIIMFSIGIGEIISLLIIKPFISLISGDYESSPDSLVNKLLNLNNTNDKTLIIGLSLIFLILVLNLLKIYNLHLINRVSAKIGTSIGEKIFSESILTKYYDFNRDDSSYIISALTNQLTATVTSLINLLKIFSSFISCFFIILGLLIINFKINILAIFLFGSTYYFVYACVKNKLTKNSVIIKNNSESHIKIIKNSIGANKEIITNNLYFLFRDKYHDTDYPLRKAKADSATYKVIPRSIIEILAITFIISIGIFDNFISQNNFIAYIASLAFGIQRLMPTMQTIFSSIAYISSESASVSNIKNLLKIKNNSVYERKFSRNLKFSEITLDNISFYYRDKKNNNENYILKDFNIKINKGEKIGIIGETGTGKSTLIELIVGLIKPQKGFVKIDGTDLHSRTDTNILFNWRNSICFLPQSPFLFDGTIIDNITFGDNSNKINLERIKESCRKAEILDYVNSLKNKFKSRVGENGTKLSGGQAQRIALARLFYLNKKIIILDEATSSLDFNTELKIINSLKALDSTYTIILITHRKEILKICSRIINIEKIN